MGVYFEERNRGRHQYAAWFTVAVLAVVVAWLAYATWGVFAKERIATRKAHDTEERLEKLVAREEALSQKVEDLATPLGIEAELREKYGVARPGEHVVMIVDDKGRKDNKDSESVQRSWWAVVRDWFLPGGKE